MTNKLEYKELLIFHPGYYIKEIIDGQGITQEELSKRLQTTPKYVSDLVNGRINLTDEMVLKLSNLFGTSTTLWLNLNQKYIERKLEVDRRMCMDKECEIVRMIDYRFWVKLGLVDDTRIAEEKVSELQRYFRVSSLTVLQDRDFLVQFRTDLTDVRDINVINANAWVQTAINIGSEMETKVYDRRLLKEMLPELCDIKKGKSDDLTERMRELLGECGVALVLLPHLRNSGVSGAVKWIGKDKVVLALSDRGKYSDAFWVLFFHELGHVLQQRIKVLNVSGADELQISETVERLEADADSFAAEMMNRCEAC